MKGVVLQCQAPSTAHSALTTVVDSRAQPSSAHSAKAHTRRIRKVPILQATVEMALLTL